MTPGLALAQGSQSVNLASAPTGTTNQTNPEIRVVAPDKVSYRYSLNGAPYSPERPIATPIRLTGNVEVGGVPFIAGSSALVEFLRLRNTDSEFTDFFDRIRFDHLESPLQVTYTLNRMRAAVLPENVLNLQGAGVADLNVTLQEKTPVGPRFELSALAIRGGKLLQRSSSVNARAFTLLLPGTAHEIALTPHVNNSQTLIFINGQPSSSGQTVVVPAPAEGQSITVQTVGPDSSTTTYTIEVRYDDSLLSTEYRAYYLRAFVAASAYVSIRNVGAGAVDYGLRFNQKFGLTTEEIIHGIQEMAPEYAGEPIQRKVWRFIRDNRYHADPLTGANWNHSPGLFFNSIGFGYCDDSASLFRHLMTALGYSSRVWALNGHVVAEVLVNSRWEMWDPDLQVHYFNRDGLVAGVDELAASPDLILNPAVRLPGAVGVAYEPFVAGIYSTRTDNGVVTWYDSVPVVGDSSMVFEIPPGGTFEFPDVYDAPLSSVYGTRVLSYTNARLIVPSGFSGTVRMPLVIQSIGWSNTPMLRVITKDAQGNWDTQPTVAAWAVDAEAPFTMATQPSGVYNSQEAVTLSTSEPATIYYTTDGSTPSEASSIYTAPIMIPGGGALRFFGVDPVGNRERERLYGGSTVQQVQLRVTSMNAATVIFSASASGGSGSYEYKFDLTDPAGTYSIGQFYSTSNVWSWNRSTALPGQHSVRVCVRNRGTMGGCEQFAILDLVIQPEAPPVLINPGDQVDNVDIRSYVDTVLSDHPVGYWRLDEESGVLAVDRAADNHGSRFGEVARLQPGSLADATAASTFDGVTGYVRVPNAPSLQLAGDLTIELWLNVSLASRQTLISKGYLREFELTLETNGALNLYQGNGVVTGNMLSVGGAVSPNVWQHIVVTRSAVTKTVRFFVNGQAKGTASYTVDLVPGTTAVLIGRSASGAQYVNGGLDEIALYSAELTAAQILKHYVMRLADGSGVPVELPLIASDPNGDVLTYSASGLPPGLTINPSTGLISGSLAQTSGGVYQVHALASDGILSHSQSFLWAVTHANRAPTLTTPGAQMHAENTPVAIQMSASDPDNDPLTFSVIGLPPALAIDPATGIIAGVLSFDSVGMYPVTVSVTDGVHSTSHTFTWVVTNTNRAPVLTNPGAQTHYARGEYAMAVMRDRPVAYWRLGDMSGSIATNILGPHPGSLVGNVALGQPGALADGDRAMYFDGASGYIQVAATPALPLAGNLTIELWVNVSLAARQTLISKDYLREFELTVETNGELNLYQGNGIASSNVRSVRAAVQPNVWQHVVVTRSAATNTIAFYVNGVAKGTGIVPIAAAAGNAFISIGRANNGSRHTNGWLDEVAIYPVVLTAADISRHYLLASDASVPTRVALQLFAFDPDGDVLTYSATNLPAGVSIDAATGLVSGMPIWTGAAISQVTVTATDGALSDSQSFTWTIERVNQPPMLASPGNQSSVEGSSISLSLSASDPDGDGLTFSATGLPPAMVLDSVTGLISGTLSFTSAGQYAVSVAVSDGRLTSSYTFTWVVGNTNRAPVLMNPGSQTHFARGEYAMAVVRDHPAAYWRLGGLSGSIAADSMGVYPGMLVGNVARGQTGALADGDRAMYFDGASGSIQVAATPALPLVGNLTIELWVNVSLAARQTLISKDYLREFELTVETNGELNLYQGNGIVSGNVRSVRAAVQPNVWQHVVVTRSAATNTIAFYVNGVAKGTGILPVAAAAGNAFISIGRANNGSRHTNGWLDDVAIYPAVLTPAEITAHYAVSTSTGMEAITLQLSGSDPDGEPLMYSAVGLPPGLALHPTTGQISGTVLPEIAGTYQVTVTVGDQTLSNSQTFTWTIEQ
jgi:concanavalin A-like lectin/glucanase superfamily protein/chitobiase/beta-hexosaminidase-like protein/putative Ig domain-containing protein